ncbi:MAG: sulfotransferase, partial [Deltaproteobacteria bacterium]|nr:sulfotransferase [Deltaproteobacteria bacterium]
FEKSPQYLAQWAALSLMLQWIENTDYQVKIIGLVRNPMSVLYSAYERFFTPPEKRQFGWAQIYRNLLSFKAMVGKDKFHLVRYEDLIAKPKQTFQEVCSFIGVDYDDKVGDDVHSRSLNKWSNDSMFTVQLHDSVKQLANHFGYTDEAMYNPPKPGISRSRKTKNCVTATYKLTMSKLIDRIIKPLLLAFRRKRYFPRNTRNTRKG